jgi:hypothetical protein
MNTKLFTKEELNIVSTKKLIDNLKSMINISIDMKEVIDEIEDIEKEDGYLEIELEYELNILITQYDYVIKNIRMIKKVIEERKLSN